MFKSLRFGGGFEQTYSQILILVPPDVLFWASSNLSISQ